MTGPAPAPALVAFDGSPEGRAAVKQAAVLFGGRPLLVVTVWDAGLAAMSLPITQGEVSATYMPPDPAAVVAVDRAVASHATTTAEDGARLAREAGAPDVEPIAVADELDAAEALLTIAEARGAAVIVVGSRGYSGLKARLHGSTTQKLLHRTLRPVLIVRTDRTDH